MPRKPASIAISGLLLLSAFLVIGVAQPQAARATTPDPVMRVGLDLAWYIRNGFGSLHGVNCNLNPSGCYTYLTHGWKNSGGQPDGTCPGGGCSGGFFTAYAYEVHNPPLYPPQYVSPSNSHEDVNWILSFIHAANIDHNGTQAKVFVRFILENNFDSTVFGTFDDFLNRLGPAQDNPAVAGFGFRGAQPGIRTGGGADSGGCEGPSFIPAIVSYGPTGMDSFPQNTSQLVTMWNTIEAKANAYGYALGVSTGLSNIDTCLTPHQYVNGLAQWFIQGSTIYPSVTAPPSTSYTISVNAFKSLVTNPPRDASRSLGVVFGEWDPNWFVYNYPQSGYYATEYGIQASLDGFAQGAAVNATRGQYWFIYGMPYLTNDDSTSIAKHGPCPFLPWILKYAIQYGYFTDFSSPLTPSAITPAYPSPSYLPPTGLFIHMQGDVSIPKPSWTQTNPVYCCGADSFYINGQLIRLSDGRGVANKQVHIYTFNFTTGGWSPLLLNGVPLVVTTDSNGWYGGSGTIGTIVVPSPELPGTRYNQDWLYPAFLGDANYGPSYGVPEDMPVVSSVTTTTTSSTTSSSTTSTSLTTSTSTSATTMTTTSTTLSTSSDTSTTETSTSETTWTMTSTTSSILTVTLTSTASTSTHTSTSTTRATTSFTTTQSTSAATTGQVGPIQLNPVIQVIPVVAVVAVLGMVTNLFKKTAHTPAKNR